MFDQTFIEASQKDRKPLTIVFSLALQGSIVCWLILMRLVYTDAMPGAAIKNLLLAPTPPRPALPKPLSTISPRAKAQNFDGRKTYMPVVIPQYLSTTVQEAPPAPDIAGMTGSIGEVNSLGVANSILSSVPQTALTPPIKEQPKKQTDQRPVSLGGRVAEANLIHRVMPAYPSIARSARIQGTVEFTALISKEGRIENLQLVHGHPLLINAAREAVLQWRYRPTLLNGEPVEVITDIVVNFTLAQ